MSSSDWEKSDAWKGSKSGRIFRLKLERLDGSLEGDLDLILGFCEVCFENFSLCC